MSTPAAEAAINTALKAVGVPFARLRFTRKANTYIVFQMVTGTDMAFADDESGAEETIYRIDLFSKKSYIATIRSIKSALKSAGFYGVVIDTEMYESDTDYYHVPIEARYLEV